MTIALALAVGALFTMGLYLMMRRSIVKLIIGLALLGNAANLLIFTSAGLTRARAPLIGEGETGIVGKVADPLPQALVLTAIVIGFAVLSFMAVLLKRTYQSVGTDDMDEMRSTDTLV